MKQIARLSGLAVLLAATHVWAAADAGYTTSGRCGGLPQLNVKTAAGFCLGLAASGLGMPRGVLPLANGEILVTDMGGWGKGKGRLLLLNRRDGTYQHTVLLEGWIGRMPCNWPDGMVYLGEAGASVVLKQRPLSPNWKLCWLICPMKAAIRSRPLCLAKMAAYM